MLANNWHCFKGHVVWACGVMLCAKQVLTNPLYFQSCCRLYATVVSTIKGYGDYFWVDVVEKIDEWGEQVLQYQNQCKKLPKALRDWQAYVDCRDTIDNFLEMLPLFQALAHKAMRERHWKSIMQITGVTSLSCGRHLCCTRPNWQQMVFWGRVHFRQGRWHLTAWSSSADGTADCVSCTPCVAPRA